MCRLARAAPGWAESDVGPAELGIEVTPGQLRIARRRAAARRRVARGQRREARRRGIRILVRGRGGYPPALEDLELPPPVLYLRGEIPDRPAVAVVGSRAADPYGLETAERFAAELAASGLTVVSGFARGVDQAAHRGALGVDGGRTVAVLGCGLDRDYPVGSRELADSISRAGAVLTEFPPGAAPRPQNFPVRNRIIAALAVGTLVVRATVRSGSLITARLALELGRDVYAVPGAIFDERARGANLLIRDGALLAQCPRDVLESLPLAVRDRLTPPREGRGGEGAGRDPVLRHLRRGEPLDPETLARRAGVPLPELLGRLAELEIAGRVRRYAGPRFGRRG